MFSSARSRSPKGCWRRIQDRRHGDLHLECRSCHRGGRHFETSPAGLTVIMGGPEVSYETDQQAIIALADYVVTGEADLMFPEVCRRLLAGERPTGKIIPGGLPDLDQLVSPYELYSDEDIAHRVIYVEASRGCPFSCEFCLSSLDVPVRQFSLPALSGEVGATPRARRPAVQVRGSHVQLEFEHEPRTVAVLSSSASDPGCSSTLR